MKAPFCYLILQTINISNHILLDFFPVQFKYLHLYFVQGFWNIAVTSYHISKLIFKITSSRA